ncbi:MAG: selenide, water dikinase SelD [Gammaproteobacteria bacterium]|nr:selenide, water dikinase SelD [Gammaproteobacteria bacterium]NNM11034.1 selenide, water dikinase SelD [Pseudomonadales bacterium]RZV49427.1 MAG: selenide, water dikinase SelD [Pseudomonadales bacterium]
MSVRLTEYSHGAGCGCKIAPAVLKQILSSETAPFHHPQLLVGNETSDDAAVFDLGNGTSIISTTDFFMPIVDDAFTFGRISATNAISDIYAMGGKPIMAIAILGWPLDKLSPEVAQQVIAGGRQACSDAGISLAGGHSIDSPEPIFGLAVTGAINTERVLRNSTATESCQLFLTKPLGVGIVATAQKKKMLEAQDAGLAENYMCRLNSVGNAFSELDGVRAMTDVTGFGLFGHLLEICRGSELSARLDFDKLPLIPEAEKYRLKGSIPGGTLRNFDSYGEHLPELSEKQLHYGCDPQTSGGLLVAVEPGAVDEFLSCAASNGLQLNSFGEMLAKHDDHLLLSFA